MALSNPRVPYKTIRDAILTLLQNNVTALSLNLATPFTEATKTTRIKAGDPRVTQSFSTLYPYVMVKISRKTEMFEAIGAGGHKKPEIIFQIFGLTRDLTDGAFDNEIMYLASNIEAVFRDNIQFDSNVLISNIHTSDFGYAEDEHEKYVDVVAMELTVLVNIQ